MRALKPAERVFFAEYLARLPARRRPRRPFVEASYPGRRAVADKLIRLYLAGKKCAGSSLVRDFESAGDPLPRRGNYWIALDGRGRPRLLLRTLRVEINRFGAIPRRVVAAEGEGDLSTGYWKRVHRAAWAPHLTKWGIEDLERAEVITEHFALLHARPYRRAGLRI